MPINVQKDHLFRPGYSIKYITGWDNLFRRDSYSGVLSFYNGCPLYIVDVFIDADRNKLEEENITITLGEYHNASDIDKMIKEKTPIIYEFCKSSIPMRFALDLQKMKIIEPIDFIETLPIRGLNTLFMFENVPSKMQYYCLVNPSRNINDSDFYSWFVSYVYSTTVCLTPRDKIDNYAKKFLQAISILCATNGNKRAVHICDKATVLDCELNDIGEFLLPVPGDTSRFEHLVEKSLEQMSNPKHKKEKNK